MKVKKISVVVAGLVLLALCIASHSFGVTITHEYDELNRLIRTTVEDTTAQVPVVSITANPMTIYEGYSSTLTWSSTYATSCEIQPDVGGPLDPNGTAPVSPTATTTYTITATGPGGTETDSVTVTVEPLPPPPTVSISADPASIAYGGTSTLSWTSTNATSCEIDQGIGTVNTNGSIAVSPIETTTYTITATGVSGTDTDTVTVTVAPPPEPTVSISANPASIDYGATSTLSWTSTDATTVSIDQGVGSVTPPEGGSIDVSPTVTTTYTITATGPGGTDTDTVTVTVAPPPEPTVSISANPASIEYGETSTLTWTSTDATTVSIDQGVGDVTPPEGGSVDVSPTETTTYTITATGPGGTATDTVTVTVAPPPEPTVSISANPASIEYGASSTLSWTSTDADTVSIDQGVGDVTPPAGGSVDVSPTETTTYTITATGPGGTATDTVTVTVTTPPPPETLTLRPNSAGDYTGIPSQFPFSGSHYDKVDEGAADDSNTYVYNGFESYDLYGIPDHTSESGVINYVKIYYRVCAFYGGFDAFKPVIKTGGTVYYGTEIYHTIFLWTTYNYTWATNPHTAAAWTWDDIDALQIGIWIYGTGSPACTQVYIEVNYTPSGGQ